MSYVFSPNSLNYIICNRCFYLEQKYGINFSGGFPQVFSDLDIAQKNYFINKSTSFLSSKLADGKFYKTVTKKDRSQRKKNSEPEFKDLEIPAYINSKILKDNKKRDFKLGGKRYGAKPDLVVKFSDGYGILDFKTTGREDKTEKYKYQLEAYAQIFEHPDEETLKLFPISEMGLVQFTPSDITNSNLETINQKMDMNYYSLKRDVNDFYNFITALIDVLEVNNIPEKNSNCKKCNDADKYLELKK